LEVAKTDLTVSRHIQSWSKLMAPLVNMIKTGCKK